MVRQGISYRQLLEHSASRGNFAPELVEDHYRSRFALLASGRPCSVEQEQPNGLVTTVSLAELIPIAEETGLIVPLGEWVLRNACATAAKWPDFVEVAVDLSPVQIRARGLVAMVTSVLARAGLAQLELGREAGCTAVQGFYFGPSAAGRRDRTIEPDQPRCLVTAAAAASREPAVRGG